MWHLWVRGLDRVYSHERYTLIRVTIARVKSQLRTFVLWYEFTLTY